VLLPLATLAGDALRATIARRRWGCSNTFVWGVLLGLALRRSGDLWLPVGLHFGWNVTTPLFGVNLSGFTMGLTGYTVRWNAGELWSGGGYGPEGGVPCTLACLGIGYLLYRLSFERQQLPLMPEE
jgi:membrane protease YdiL (CAAX protease family)